MSNDKAPEKLYFNLDESGCGWATEMLSNDVVETITYIREDLTLDEKLKKETFVYDNLLKGYRGATEGEKKQLQEMQRPALTIDQLRRREMFEKVALAILNENVGKTIEMESDWLELAAQKADKILSESGKFAKGEK